MNKQFIQEEELLLDSYRLAVQVYASGFRPDFIVGVWRGGSTVGIYVQECLQYLGISSDHIPIRTSYRGMADYLQRQDRPETIRVNGLQYLVANLGCSDSLLIVDDVFSSGRSMEAVITRLKVETGRNMPTDVRIAAPFCKPSHNQTGRTPDYFLHETDSWLVLPYELTGLDQQEMERSKPWALPILEQVAAATGIKTRLPGRYNQYRDEHPKP
jgi:uncharacterized protein